MLTSYDSIIAACAAGKHQGIQFGKSTITTVANAAWSLWYNAGVPGPGSVSGAALTAAAASRSTAGAMQFLNPTGPDILNLTTFTGMTSVANFGMLYLVDRLLYYPGLTIGSVAPIALTAGAALPRYTTGEGVMAFLETTANVTQGAGTFSMSYTNQAGTAGRTSETVSYVANPTQGRIHNSNSLFVGLQSTDTGIRTIESITFSSTSSAGSFAIVLAKVLAMVPMYTANAAVERDCVINTPRFPEIKTDACLSLIAWMGTTSVGQLFGDIGAVAG